MQLSTQRLEDRMYGCKVFIPHVLDHPCHCFDGTLTCGNNDTARILFSLVVHDHNGSTPRPVTPLPYQRRNRFPM
jgi:hypothetical protein